MKLHEVLKYGAIVNNDEEIDILITANPVYFNAWGGDQDGNYSPIDAYDLNSRIKPIEGFDSPPIDLLIAAAKILVDDIKTEFYEGIDDKGNNYDVTK